MKQFTDEQRHAAQTLAVAYHAYMDAYVQPHALTPTQWNTVYVWGIILRGAQEKTGLVMVENLAEIITQADKGSACLAPLSERIVAAAHAG